MRKPSWHSDAECANRRRGARIAAGSLVRATALVVLCSLSSISCAERDVDLPGSGGQTIVQLRVTRPTPVVIVLAVDDAETVSGDTLRADVHGALSRGLDRLRDKARSSSQCGNSDPAEWNPGELRVVVVRPSAPDDEALLAAPTLPGLSLSTLTWSATEIDALTKATELALTARLATPGEPFRPLRAVRRTVELLGGLRAPINSDEAALLGVLPNDERSVDVLLAATRDDESTGEPADEIVNSQLLAQTGTWPTFATLGPFGAEDDVGCSPVGASGTRLEAWSSAVGGQRLTWPCSQPLPDFPTGPIAHCGPRCTPRRLEVEPSGRALCRVTVDQPDLERCAPELGWSDPAGADGVPRPTRVNRSGTKLRRCEVRQLEGADLIACRTSLDCAGCAPGYCATEVPALLRTQECPATHHPFPLRFIGGARAAASWVRAVCEIEP